MAGDVKDIEEARYPKEVIDLIERTESMRLRDIISK